MSNLLGGATSSNSSSGGNTQLDSLVASYRQTLQPRLDNIKKKQTALETKQRFYTTLNTRLNSVITTLDRFDKNVVKDLESKFVSKSAKSSNNDVVTVSAKNGANIGVNTIKVNRLATSDILVSKQVQKAEALGIDAGIQKFTINVGSESKEYEVTLDGTETYEQAVNKLVSVINADEDAKLRVSMIKDTTNTLRMTFTSKELGTENKISFNDSDLLSKFGLDSSLNSNSTERKVFDETTAGFKIGKTSELDSEVVIEGIKVTRSSNTLTDVLPDIEINLLKTQKDEDTPVTLTTAIDTEPIEKLIEPLLNSFNELINYVRQDSATRRGEPTINQLYSNLRSLPSSQVTSVEAGAPNFITNIGITADTNGVLKITNKETLKKVLTENPQAISDLFLSEDGFVSKLNSIVERLKGDNGVIKSRRDNLQTQIDSTIRQYKASERTIDNQLEGIRKRYTSMLDTFLKAQGKYGTASTVSNAMFGQA